ncbi:MAG: hypothetical protein LBV39_02860 [Bacteroidales bacterium]|jgi:uncharacterized protein YfaS (alpha-2-macroglobulin family)|nr:hypothetical protein [Bacteroidales bacterium]
MKYSIQYKAIYLLFVGIFCLLISINIAAQVRPNDASRWNNIENFIDDGLPQSAMVEIDAAYRSALTDKDYGRLLKAVKYRIRCQQMSEEQPDIAIIRSLTEDAEQAPYPAKAVIYSLTGEAYRDFYYHNRWKLVDRTTINGENTDDINTWSASQLIEKINSYLLLSLSNPATLQKTPVSVYKDVLAGDAATRFLRSTLYDLLAHRAIDILSEPNIMNYDFSTFLINRAEYFADTQGFAQTTIVSADTLAPAYCVMKIFHDLTIFHLNRKDINALADVDMKRLSFVRNNGIYPTGDEMYEKALHYLLETSSGQKIWETVASTLALWYKEEGEKWGRTNNPKCRYRLADAVNLYNEIVRKTGSKDERKHAETILNGLKQKRLNIQLQKEQIPCRQILAMLNYQNTNEAYITVYRTDEQEEINLDNLTEKEQLAYLSHLQKLSQQHIRLPQYTDYQSHRVELRLDSLEAGRYWLVTSDLPDFSSGKLQSLSYTNIQVSNLFPIQRYAGGGVMEAYVTDRTDGTPMEGASVKVYRKVYRRITSSYENLLDTVVLTDASGRAFFRQTSGNRYLWVIHNGDSIQQAAIYAYTQQENKEVPKLAFFTDRAIYRPGQTVYFKGLLYTENDGNGQVKPQEKLTVKLIDANGKEVQQQDFTTNDFGSINGSFVVPHGLLNGVMQLQSMYHSTTIRVEEYKRPTFEILIQSAKENYALGDYVEVTGEAKALAGYPVDGATVAWEVQRHILYRPLRYHFLRSFPPIPKQQRLIAAGSLKTGDIGQFSLAFKAEDEDIMDKEQIYVYELKIDVTDQNGETQSISKNIRLSKNPLLLDTTIPDNIAISTDSLKYKLDVTNLDGEPIPAGVYVELFALQSPQRILRDRLWAAVDTVIMPYEKFSACFPFDIYGNENEPNKEKKQLKASWSIDTKERRQIDMEKLRTFPSGQYLLKFVAQNANGLIVDTMLVNLQHVNTAIIDMNQWLINLETKAEPGDTVTFWIAGGNENSHIRCNIMLKDSTIEHQTFTVGTIPRQLRFPVKDEYRGGFAVQFVLVQENRSYTALRQIDVPYTNKKLDVKFQTFRSKLLPGEKEKWTLTVTNKQGKGEAAEMAAVLYDASLDMFTPHSWQNTFYWARHYDNFSWQLPYQNLHDNTLFQATFNMNVHVFNYEKLEVFGAAKQSVMMKSRRIGASVSDFDDMPLPEAMNMMASGIQTQDAGVASPPKMPYSLETTPLRTNFSETAFFYPALHTNAKGELSVEFTIPDALTRWNMFGFAHTKDLKTGNTLQTLVTQKQIAINANLPRFLRQGDVMTLTAKLNNLTTADQKISALIRFYDAYTMQPINAQILKSDATQFATAEKGQSAVVKWDIEVPADLQAVTYQLTAQAGNHSDGEERSVPVLSNKILITETMPFLVRADSKSDLRFEKLAASKSTETVQHKRLTLEYTTHPAWYAVQAIPVLMEQTNESAEQTFTRFYANRLATVIANSTPRIRRVFSQWRSIPDSKALLSNLEKNQELKQALLEETPWVMQAANETERKKRIGLLFDLNRMANEQQDAWEKLKRDQGANGGFPWFAGQPESRGITQYIVGGLERMRRLGALPRTEEVNDVIEKALTFCDAQIHADYKKMLEDKSGKRQYINGIHVQYLYLCSFSQRRSYALLEAFDFYMQQAEEYWARLNLYEQAMTALVMYRYGKTDVAQSILRSMKERAQISDQMGMYWADNRSGRFWNESPVETQAMLIEAFSEAGSDTKAVDEMKLWLLRNKQTNDWKTSKATTAAVYALLHNDYELFEDTKSVMDVRIAGKPLNKMVKEPLNPEPGTGYVNTTWNGKEINASMADLRIINPTADVVWGAMYWQYVDETDKVTSAETQLKVSKQLFVKQNTSKGKVLHPISKLKNGDIVTIRLEVHADTDFEYVHLKDTRAAGFEPANPMSGYRYRNGLGYSESYKDASVNFFIHYLPKGVWVFEYDVRVTNKGSFSNGIATVQCMYAPEFNAHSDGERIKCGE